MKKRKKIICSVFIIVEILMIATISSLKILQVNGNSMEPSLYTGDILIASQFFKFEKGDMIAFYYNESILIRRIIATDGDVVIIEDNGEVYVNSVKIEENYIKNFSYGNCNIEFPYQVPKGQVFVLGDNREISIDSRNTSIGCISEEQIIGKIHLKLKPFVIY